jgi:hypothetical protein
MNPNPELEATLNRRVLLCLGESLLHGYGTLDRIDDTGELGQNTIPPPYWRCVRHTQ